MLNCTAETALSLISLWTAANKKYLIKRQIIGPPSLIRRNPFSENVAD